MQLFAQLIDLYELAHACLILADDTPASVKVYVSRLDELGESRARLNHLARQQLILPSSLNSPVPATLPAEATTATCACSPPAHQLECAPAAAEAASAPGQRVPPEESKPSRDATATRGREQRTQLVRGQEVETLIT